MSATAPLTMAASAALDEETARAELYGLLAQLYYSAPAPGLLATLRVAVTQAPARLKEAAKLGFAGAVLPAATNDAGSLQSTTIDHVGTLVSDIAARSGQSRTSPREADEPRRSSVTNRQPALQR